LGFYYNNIFVLGVSFRTTKNHQFKRVEEKGHKKGHNLFKDHVLLAWELNIHAPIEGLYGGSQIASFHTVYILSPPWHCPL
jgi:hypothetical protein